MKIIKNYHAWLDISLGKLITQPMQRILLNDFVKKIGGKIIFELGEDVEFKSFHLQLQNMIEKKNKCGWIYFLRFRTIFI